MLEYSRHAEDRLAERGISRQDVEHAFAHQLGSPEPGNRPGNIVVTGTLPAGGSRLKIVLGGVDPNRYVVTAWRV